MLLVTTTAQKDMWGFSWEEGGLIKITFKTENKCTINKLVKQNTLFKLSTLKHHAQFKLTLQRLVMKFSFSSTFMAAHLNTFSKWRSNSVVSCAKIIREIKTNRSMHSIVHTTRESKGFSLFDLLDLTFVVDWSLTIRYLSIYLHNKKCIHHMCVKIT